VNYVPRTPKEHFAILREQLPMLWQGHDEMINPFTLALMVLAFFAAGTIVAQFLFSAQRRFWSSYSQNLSKGPGNSGIHDNKAVGKHLVWLATGGVLATVVPVGWLFLILSEPATSGSRRFPLGVEDRFYILFDDLPLFFKGRDDRIFTRSTFALLVLAFFAAGIVVAQFVFLAQRRFWSSCSQHPSKEPGNSEQNSSESDFSTVRFLVDSVFVPLGLVGPGVVVFILFSCFPPILVAMAVGSIGGWYRDRLFTAFTYCVLLLLYIWVGFQAKPLDYTWLYEIPLTLPVTILTYALVAKSRGLQGEERTPAAKGVASSSETAVSETAVFSKNVQ
jgi:uncharacterized membrane protein SpoIIM required for sporulation